MFQAAIAPAETRATIAAASTVTERSTVATSSPRASRSASALEIVCSIGRKRTMTARNMAAHSTAIWPYAAGPSARAASTWNT